MARNNNKMVKRRKIEPAVMTVQLNLNIPATSTVTRTLDLSQVASLLNRRFYRQGLNWAVGGFKMLSSTVSPLNGSVRIDKLPQTWVMSNAWHKSFAHWQEMNNNALAESESVRPRFLDFKIYANATHHTAGYGDNLLPVATTMAIPGEWEASKMVIPIGAASPGNTADREILAVGANYPGPGFSGLDAVSLIEGYAASRGLPNVLDPNAPSDADDATGFNPGNWLAATFSEGTDQTQDVLEFMISENNIAPYPFENDGVNLDTMYPGGANQLVGLQTHDLEFTTGTTIGATTRLKGGLFPCGLVQFTFANNAETSVTHDILIDLVPGSHRGYLAEPMQDM